MLLLTTRPRFYARDRKENRTIFGSSRRSVETNLRPLNPIMTPAAQMLRNVHELDPLTLTAHEDASSYRNVAARWL